MQSFFESDRRRLVRFAKKRRREPGKSMKNFPGSRNVFFAKRTKRLRSDSKKLCFYSLSHNYVFLNFSFDHIIIIICPGIPGAYIGHML